jgi:hypothetical protein
MKKRQEVLVMREFVQGDGNAFGLTETYLNDPALRNRLVRTQIEELWTLYSHYPIEELSAVRQILEQLRQSYRDVEPFDHPMLAQMLDNPQDEE